VLDLVEAGRKVAEVADDLGISDSLEWSSPWDGSAPLDAAEREGAGDVVDWLRREAHQSAQSNDRE
jgi:hypothetical protein